MKKHLFLMAALFAAFGCGKEAPVETPSCPSNLSITVGMETKAFLDASGATPVMKWRTTDSLVVFDSSLAGVAFGGATQGSTSATFTTDKWTGKAPHYAAAYCPNYGEEKIMTSPAEGVMSVKFRESQVLDNLKCGAFMGSALVGKVEENAGEYSISEMKNAIGYIGFTISGTDVKSVKISGLNDESVAGWVDVDYEKLAGGDAAFWTPTADKSPVKTVTLTPSANGAANYNKTGAFTPSTYYASILPQTYSKGLKFIVTKSDGTTMERTIGTKSGITITRNQITPIGGFIDKLPVNYPDEVILDFDFTTGTNPFGFTDPGIANEDPDTGETYPYTYNFTDAKTGQPASVVLDFTICRTSTASTHYYYKNLTNNAYGAGYVLVFDAQNSWIKIPAIENHYLQAVTASLGNSAAKEIGVKDTPASTSSVGIVSIPAATASGPVSRTMQFYTNGNDGTNVSLQGVTTKISTGYTIHLRSKNGTRLAHLTLKYTKTLPTK